MDKWKELEARLQGVFVSVTVYADTHEVTFQKRLDGERLVIQVFVDGWIRGEWSRVDKHGKPICSEGRLYRPMRSRLYALKQYQALKRVFGKKEADRLTMLRTVAVSPYWNSPKTLVSHLKKHFPDLLIKPDDEVAP